MIKIKKMEKNQKKSGKNLENPKTPPFDDLDSVQGILFEKLSAKLESENASLKELINQKNLSTFQTNYNRYRHMKHRLEKTDPVSNTIPDKSLSIREIYSRYVSGRPIFGNPNVQYDWQEGDKFDYGFDDIMPDLNRLDIAERHDIINETIEALNELKKKAKATADAREQRKKQEDADFKTKLKQFEDWQKSQSTQTGQSTPDSK